jgi:hypothetical protein
MCLALADPLSLQLPHFVGLRWFLSKPELFGIVPRFRVFVYLHKGPPILESLFMAIRVLGKGPSPTIHAQIALEPLGYIITAEDMESSAWARDRNLCEITRFSLAPAKRHQAITLELPVRDGRLPW